MTKDDIMQALRRLANGFPNHPEVERLANALTVVLETPEERSEREQREISSDDLIHNAGWEIAESTEPVSAKPARKKAK